MLPKGLIAGLLVVSLLTQGLPISVCRCALAAAAKQDSAKEPVAGPVCPHCVAKPAEASTDVAPVAKTRSGEVAFAVPCCCRDSAGSCCVQTSRSRTIATTDVSVPERPAPQAWLPTDPLADLSGVSVDSVAPGAVPDVPPRLPVRILLCVWRK